MKGIMSEEIFNDGRGLSITRFSGGEHRGVCIQITTPDYFTQLTKSQVTAMLPVLREFIGIVELTDAALLSMRFACKHQTDGGGTCKLCGEYLGKDNANKVVT